MPDYGSDLFAGTAKYYAKYRAKYPPDFFNDVVAFFDLDGHGRMLDLGCGTGELAIPLAPYFEKVLAIDPDSEMLAEGRRKAKAAKTVNIEWQEGSSMDITGVEGQFKLVGMGKSFHWMDGRAVLGRLYELIEPDGGICIIASPGRTRTSHNRGITEKDQAVRRLVAKYLGPQRLAGNTIYEPPIDDWENDLFPSSRFGGFKKRIYVINVVRDVEQELGNLYSMSWGRREFFGRKIQQFEREFRRALYTISESGKFSNRICFEVYFLKK